MMIIIRASNKDQGYIYFLFSFFLCFFLNNNCKLNRQNNRIEKYCKKVEKWIGACLNQWLVGFGYGVLWMKSLSITAIQHYTTEPTTISSSSSSSTTTSEQPKQNLMIIMVLLDAVVLLVLVGVVETCF